MTTTAQPHPMPTTTPALREPQTRHALALAASGAARSRGRPWGSALRAAALLVSAALAGCPGGPAPYRVIAAELPEGLFSVSGRSASDVWVVGSDPGSGPAVLRWDGTRWERLATGQTGDLWWVHPVTGGPVLMSGEDGMILRYEGGTFERMTTPASGVIVFGMWAAAPDDIYAVGGAGGSSGFVWHHDGSSWSEITLPDHLDEAVFKVWGTGATDVWVCGFGGVLYHFDGASWTRVPSTTTRTLLTLHTVPGQLTAVGGAGTGVIVERGADGTMRDVTPELAPQLMGVWLTPTGGRATGINGAIYRREEGAWIEEVHGLDLFGQLHSVWMDPEGGVWSVGGQILAEPFSGGIIVYQGERAVTGLP